MDKAEQPTVTQALKPCPEAEAIAQGIADRSRWKKTTDNYARIYQAAYAGAIAALNTRTTSLAAQDGLVEALKAMLHAVCGETGFANAVRGTTGKAYPWPALDIAEGKAIAALSAIKEQHHD